MRYSTQQLEAVGMDLQKKFIAGEVKNYEIVIALIAMCEAGRLSTSDIRNVLCTVFFNNLKGIAKALELASGIIDRDMLDAIMEDVAQN